MKNKWLKFFLYARKSQESDERQVQSIEDQINAMKKKAGSLWYNIVWIFTESKSAKAPGRPKFDEMIQRIQNWEASWIISWKLDRITRNPRDTGKVQYMLQNGSIKLIHTNDWDYDINNSGLMFSVMSWMANQFLIDLSISVKRWIEGKVSKWWYPWVAPEWYLNDLSDHTIKKNPTNFKLLKKMWSLMLTGNYSVLQIVDIANNEWWFKTTKRKKQWWKSLSYGSWYRIFNNIFYTWYFRFKWVIHKWNHDSMISLEDFNRVQKILWDKGKAKVIKHEFIYWGIFNCWCCNFRITAENKLKKYKSWNSKLYSYYRCTKKNKDIQCDNIAIQEKDLEIQFLDLLKWVKLDKDFYNWALDIIERESASEIDLLKEQKLNLDNQIKKIDKKLDKLNDLYLEWWIDIEKYNQMKNNLEEEKILYSDSLKNFKWKYWYNIDEIKKIISFGYKALDSFKKWDIKLKKNIIKSIGSDYSLYMKKMTIQLNPWYNYMYVSPNPSSRKSRKVGPSKNSNSTGSTDAVDSNIVIWQGPQELHLGLSGSESEHSSN